MSGVVERFLGCMTSHDWSTLRACLTDDVVRVGPYGDTYRSRSAYVELLVGLLPTLPGYAIDVTRVTYADGVAYAELVETVTVDGAPLRTPECLVFALTPDALIARVDVFIQTQPS